MMQRSIFSFLIVAVMLCVSTSGSAIASKHAVLIYDVDTGRVIHQENGYAKRYPASLTKMMTLYMLFEQLRAGNVKLGTQMRASAHAAAQPQTNISLRKGDAITVDQAIRALVVRSANDVAVVVAEHLGGSEARFAKMATEKARRLGMQNTYFKNPHGLPNQYQTTTAYDMALLGMALRRDFPQYYNYFQTKKFSYKGKHFKSHNRVLDALPGVDGIKTGYIRASGFNLVSSLKTRDANVVAVVMGGTSGSSRDAKMVELLKVTQNQLAGKKTNANYKVANAPVPQLKPEFSGNQLLASAENMNNTPALNTAINVKRDTIEVYPAPVLKPLQLASVSPEEAAPITMKPNKAISEGEMARLSAILGDSDAAASPQPETENTISLSFDADAAAKPSKLDISIDDIISKSKASSAPVAAKPVVAPVAKPAPSTIAKPQVMPEKNTLDYQLATLNKEFTVPTYIFKENKVSPQKNWAVQIGVFKDTLSARRALSQVARNVRSELRNAVADVEYAENGSRGFHRARLKNLSEDRARKVCNKLSAMNQDCFAVKM